MNRIKVVPVIGTRPEVIKMAPVIKELERYPEHIESIIVSTAQHRQMLDQILEVFDIKPHMDLDIMKPDQSLFQITHAAMEGMEKVVDELSPDLILIQGDTSTVFATALAAFYKKVPVGHIEAGLRSYDKFNPYPEEINRRLATVLTDYHYAPTVQARDNLIREGVEPGKIYVTGNTVVDALNMILEKDSTLRIKELEDIDFNKERMILVTAHRRENWGRPLENICRALKELVGRFDDLRVVYPVHLNPNVIKSVNRLLHKIPRIHLIAPIDYLTFVRLMNLSYLIVTDSGGIQEEAPSLGKPVLVLRKVTERPEAVQAGLAKIIGTDYKNIVKEVSYLLENPEHYQRMIKGSNPYVDGKAAERIVHMIRVWLFSNQG